MNLKPIVKKIITSEILDLPWGAKVKVPTKRYGNGVYSVEEVSGDKICVCVLDDDQDTEYEWYHYTECQVVMEDN